MHISFRIATLLKWKQHHPFGQYNDLLKICCEWGDTETADVIFKMVKMDDQQGMQHYYISLAQCSHGPM